MDGKYQNQGNRGTSSRVIDKNVFCGGHFEISIFEFSILKNPLGQIVMLISGSAHIKLKMLHIRSTTSTDKVFDMLM